MDKELIKPLSAFISVFCSLLERVFSDPLESASAWRRRILRSLPVNAKVFLGLLPTQWKVTLLGGQAHEMLEQDTTASIEWESWMKQFRTWSYGLLRLFASEKRPLVRARVSCLIYNPLTSPTDYCHRRRTMVGEKRKRIVNQTARDDEDSANARSLRQLGRAHDLCDCSTPRPLPDSHVTSSKRWAATRYGCSDRGSHDKSETFQRRRRPSHDHRVSWSRHSCCKSLTTFVLNRTFHVKDSEGDLPASWEQLVAALHKRTGGE